MFLDFIVNRLQWLKADKNGSITENFSTAKLETTDIVTHNYPGLTVERILTPKAYSGAASETGAIEIKLPLHSANGIRLIIKLRHHGATNTDCIIHIGGYLKDQTDVWHATFPNTTQIFGEFNHTKKIQLGYRTIAGIKYATVIIGDIADAWLLTSLQIMEVSSGIAGFSTAWQDAANYSIAIVNPLSADYTNQFTTYPSVYGIDSFNRIRKLGTLGIERTLEFTDADGSVTIYPNAYTLDAGTTIKARNAGILQRLRLEGSDGKAYLENSASLTADETATFAPPTGQNRQLFPLGSKSGMRLTFQSVSTPPVIEAGSVEVLGRLITLNSDKSMAMSDVPTGSHQIQLMSLYVNKWHLLAVDQFGKFVWMPWYPDTSILGNRGAGAIASIVVSAGVGAVTLSTGSAAGLAVNDLVTFYGTDGGSGACDGTFRVGIVTDATHFSVSISAPDGTYNGGTWTWRYFMITLHGTGSGVGVTTLTDTTKYTPYFVYDPKYGGYYVDLFGIPTLVDTIIAGNRTPYRVIGCYYTNGSGQVVDDMISFGQCKEKNDNYIESDGTTTAAVASGTPFRLAIPTRFSKLWGTDYIAEDEATPTFFRITAQTKLKYWFSINGSMGVTSNLSSEIRLRENGVIKKTIGFSQGATGVTLGDIKILNNNGKLNNLSYIDLTPVYDSATPPNIFYLEAIFNLDNGD